SSSQSPPPPILTNGSFTITSTVNDTTPPAVQSLSVSPSTVGAGNAVTVTARLTDANTGVQNWPTICYRLPGTPTDYCNILYRMSGTAQDGVWSTLFPVPDLSPSGTALVDFLSLTDRAGNY